jgi:hypothetical protein
MTLYMWLLVPKFVGVLLLAAGYGAAFLGQDLTTRKRAVHGTASTGLLLTWAFGLFATQTVGIPFTELWIVGSLALSFGAHSAVLWSVMGESRPRLPALLGAGIPLALVLLLMVSKLQWAQLRGA